MKFRLGESEHERVEVDVLSYERPAAGDYLDDWVTVSISVQAGGFSGCAGAAFLTADFPRFAAQLHRLYEQLNGSAEFATMEGQLSLTLTCDVRGHIALRGEVLDHPGVGNRLNFHLDLDQSHLAETLRELDAVIKAFPVRHTKA